MNISKLSDIGCYVGLRHTLSLPFMDSVRDLMQILNVVNVFAFIIISIKLGY